MLKQDSMMGVLRANAGQRVFMHDLKSLAQHKLDSSLVGNGLGYGERCLWLAQAGDVVVLDCAPDPEYLATLRQYLPELAQVHLVNPGPLLDEGLIATLCQAPNLLDQILPVLTQNRVLLNCLVACPGVEQVAAYLRTKLNVAVETETGAIEATQMANNKRFIHGLATMSNVPVPTGEVLDCAELSASDRSRVCYDTVVRQAASRGRAMVRGIHGANGSDTHIFSQEDQQRLNDWATQRSSRDCFIVAPLLPLTGSPNCPAWIYDEENWALLAINQQRLDAGYRHHGNVVPYSPPHLAEILDCANRITASLAKIGVRGAIGIDLMETYSPESTPTLALAEVNARYNGSHLTLSMWERLNEIRLARGLYQLQACLSHAGRQCRLRSFAALRRVAGQFLYSHDKGQGVVLLQSGLLKLGALNFVTLAADESSAFAVEAEFMAAVYE